ncbi:hypothetical protein UFOVP368_57 [uncultured Caudovirales phage]|uniref:Uncharacterized protein n=1 Tax=uncultured Caudovirales phage TaxID=2100421 RepID=A0A6J7X1W0_9CAUD|nr:hypothetical protein UFOVP368_57 [uncultured Caudovirales phage]
MIYPQNTDSEHNNGLLTHASVLERKRPGKRYQRSTGPDPKPLFRSDLWL